MHWVFELDLRQAYLSYWAIYMHNHWFMCRNTGLLIKGSKAVRLAEVVRRNEGNIGRIKLIKHANAINIAKKGTHMMDLGSNVITISR